MLQMVVSLELQRERNSEKYPNIEDLEDSRMKSTPYQ